MRRPEFIARQSARPSGILGRVIAWIMARETAGGNAAARRLLELAPTDHVLEIGFGHGHNVLEIARAVPDGLVAGIDHSADMHALASALCGPLVASGRVRLSCADSSDLPYGDTTFDKAVAMNTLYFWPDPLRQLTELRRVLRHGGRLVLGFRPKDEASRDFPEAVYRFHARADVEQMLARAGFAKVRVEALSSGFLLACAE
ncbi:methyltransferase domain-containing protein [Candidatus Binatia bacterium]|nr:methyltransferase domain-containing protein [Candidatus Binatia bacterium]